MASDVRLATRADLDALAGIEAAGDRQLAAVLGPTGWDPPPSGTERLGAPGFLLVAGRPPRGFAHVLELEGRAHLEQLAVRPSQQRRGTGSALVREAMRLARQRGHDRLTLCTFADVAWNAPFYRRLGFEVVEQPTGLLQRLREHERDLGLDRLGTRVAMAVALGGSAPRPVAPTSELPHCRAGSPRGTMPGMTSSLPETPAPAAGRDFGTIGVIGLGTMGAGIAEVFARHGFPVVGVEVNEEGVARARQHLQHSTDRAVSRGKMSGTDQAELLGRISITCDLQDLADADLVVEAVVENLEVKKGILRDLDTIVGPDTVLATNTSSLSVTELSTASARPGRVIGVHFFNPAPVQNLVEVVRTVVTEPTVLDDVKALVERIGKNPVVCGDKAGFIANTLLFGYLNHAVSMYEGRYASREDIDAAMRYGCGYPMGPLALLDLIGLDTAYEILETMYRQGRDRLHAPAPILKQMVTAGMLGRKTGRGFYTYESADSPVVVPDDRTPSADDVPRLRHDIDVVGVVGTGTMATGIVEVFAKAGYDVLYVGRTAAKVDGVRATIERSLDKAIQRGKLEESARGEVLGRIRGSVSLDDLRDVDIVVEAIAEDLRVKTTLFENLDEICKPGAILATTTSSLPVIACAQATKRPQDVVGMHFFNPAPVMKLVEVVSTVTTDEAVTETTRALCAAVGKVAVSCGDRAGFIVNALLFPYLNDAVRMLEAHYATADDIDLAMKQGCALPMGPFELLDVVGNDVSLAIQRELYLEFREPGFAPAPLLEHLVTAGYLGRKTQRGFRDYSRR